MNDFTKDVEELQRSIKKLSNSIKKCGVDWKDAKYTALAEKVKPIADDSKQIIIASERCKKVLASFLKVEAE